MKKCFVLFLMIAAAGQIPVAIAGKGANHSVLHDTARIAYLNKQAEMLLKNNYYDSSMVYSSQAIEISDSLLRLSAVKSNSLYQTRCKMLKTKAMANFSNGLIYNKPNDALDTLKSALKLAKETGNKSLEAVIYADIGNAYNSLSKDKAALVNHLRSVSLFRETGSKKELAWQLNSVGITQRVLGNYGDALEYMMESLKISRSIGDSNTTIEALLAIGFTYAFVEMWDDALKFQAQALDIYREMNDSLGIARIYNDMGVTNMRAGKLEVALDQHKKALAIRLKSKEHYYTFASFLYIGDLLEKLNRIPEAIQYYESAFNYTKFSSFRVSQIDAGISLGRAYQKSQDYDKALNMLALAYEVALEMDDRSFQAQAALFKAKVYLAKENPRLALFWLHNAEKAAAESSLVYLAEIYQSIGETYSKMGDFRNAYLNQLKYSRVKDSMDVAENLEKIARLSNRLEFENKQALQNQNHEKELILKQAEIRREKVTRNFSLFGMFVAMVLMIIAFIRFVEKQKLNKKLSETLSDLKSTQSQLIQREKMASLGELAAGISHEIQNPLNFVNNFSEVSRELISEVFEELSKGNQQDAMNILEDVKENLDKINHHGKRADSIIKGMLQHSRSSSGTKEPTDINALADEFLRLAYHGLRARDKSFNALMKTDFDQKLGKVNVIPQDMGRVILNLITNAFYAANEKRITGKENYQPTVQVSTRKTKDKVMVLVQDNGNGIPQHVLGKIFQPFFTTKPAGEGTGLGLSMSYDIVTKGHGGELTVETSEGLGTTFTIVIPA
ncbi:MAG: tetratricopeptide repeat protein [Lentimicrobium sp.]|nr:tetratricopeptide repeat protein [Lentimicrobium sp.]